MTQKTQKIAGFSFVEITIAMAALGLMVAIAIPAVNRAQVAARASKLSTEVTSLNAAVKSFVSNGGRITADASATEVLNLLKAELSATDKQEHVGYTGSFVDQRLTAKPISADTPGPRAVWDFGGKKFVLTEEEVDGIAAFIVDKNAVKSTETRDSNSLFKFSSSEESWVWTYGEEGEKVVITPTPVSTTPDSEVPDEPILISLIPIVDPTPPDPEIEGPPPVDPNRLSPPTFSIGGGNFPLGNYQMDLAILNPNADVPSSIFYRKNGSDWSEYQEGHTLTITPETDIDAFVFSLNPTEFTSSSLSSSSYNSEPVQIDLSLDADNTLVSYYDLVDDEVRVRWDVNNLNAVPDYLRTDGFFTTYWTDDSSDPAFGNRNVGESYSSNYEGESMRLTPDMWQGTDSLEITAYAESSDVSWIKNSEKPSVAISIKKENLPEPDIDLQDLGNGKFLVRLTPSADMPPGAELYYNSTGETMSFDTSSGQVAEGTLYTNPFQWEPDLIENTNNGEGATGSVNIDRGNGDVPIQQVVLKTNNNLVTQNSTVAFDVMENPGADSMRGATVNDNSSAEITIESITINDNGNIIVADQVNVLDVTVSNLNYPDTNLDRVAVYENGVNVGNANGANFGQMLQDSLQSKDLRDYIRYDGNNNLLHGTPYDFDVNFSPLTNNDYLVVAERFGNSTFDLEALDASGNVIGGSNKVIIREYSWNTGYAPSDHGGQPMFLAVVDIEKFGVDTDANSITGFRVNDDGGADIKFFTISDDSFDNRPVNYEGDLTAAAYPPAELANWFSPSSSASTTVEGQVEVPELENPVEANINFKKLTTSAGFLNEGFLVVNGVEHQFLTSDDAMGGMLDVAALVDPGVINTIDLKIYTTPRLGGQATYERELSYHSSLHGLYQVQPWESFNGAHADRAKVKDTSYSGTTRLEFAFEDLIHRDPYGWLDNDYNDYNFEISMPDWVEFEFGGNSFGGNGQFPGGQSNSSFSAGSSSSSDQSSSSSSNSDSGTTGNGNSNNGHGNNADGVDVSNPGQGNGGPNGATDESGDYDDENNNNSGGRGRGRGRGRGNR